MSDELSPYQNLMLKAAQDEGFRHALIEAPKEALEAYLGTKLPETLNVKVVENSPSEITLVLPPRSAGELSEEELGTVTGGNAADDAMGILLDVYLTMSGVGLLCIVSAADQGSIRACRKMFGK